MVRNGQGAQHQLGGEDLEGLVGLLAGELTLGNLAAALLVGDVVDLLHGARVKQVVLRHPEDLRDLVIVGHHHLALERLAVGGVRNDGVELLCALEGKLPEVELGSGIELLHAHVHLEPQAHVAPRDCGQVRVGGVLQVGLEQVLEAPELGLALVAHAEVEGLLGRVRVQVLKLAVVLQHLEARAVRLPQEAEPLHVVVPVRAARVAQVVGQDAQHHRLGRLLRLQVRQVGHHLRAEPRLALRLEHRLLALSEEGSDDL
mmetsp:Transcript_35982/g.91990  ORF Transcript_35982/g.91990 Transcript_35982/m.91990 type:complete len:259 (-) Transcript_35982:407-1183(-)